MDRSLDEIIGERPQRGRGKPEMRRLPPPSHMRASRAAAQRRDEQPRDGVRKNRETNRYDERQNLDSDWVHDKYEEDRYERERPEYRPYDDHERSERPSRREETGSKIRVDNIHYELTESDINELFTRVGPIISTRMLYDRSNRSQGTAYVIYQDPRDAQDAVAQFDGCNANGQPIRLTLVPNGPAAPSSKGNLFDRIERPSRSLFDRIQDGARTRNDSREDGSDTRRRRGRARSESPHVRPAPEHIDRYVPGARRASRSPIGRRGTPREGGRRPGQRREENGRGGPAPRRGGRAEGEGRQVVGGRPRKTAEELDAEMADYWGKPAEQGNGAAATTNGSTATAAAPAAAPAPLDDDIDMIE